MRRSGCRSCCTRWYVVPLRASSSCTLGNWSLSINALLEPTDPKLPPALRQCPLSAYPTLLSQLQPGWLCTFLLIDVEWSPDDSVSFHPNAPALVTMDINFITQEQVKQYRPVLVLGTLPTASTHGCSSSVSFNTTTRVSTATVCQGGRWLLVYNPYPPYIRPLSWILTLVGVPLGGLVALALIIILSRVVWVWFHSRIKPVPLSNPLPIVHKPRKIHRAFARQEKVLLTKLDDIVIDKDSKYAADAQGGRQEPPDPAIARASSLERSMTEQLPVPASPPSPPAPSPFLRLAALLRLRREGHAPPYRPRVHIHVSAGGVATTEPPSNAGTAAAFAADIAAEGINSMKRRKAAAKRHNKHRLQILQDPEFEHGYPQLLGIQRVSEAKKEMARLKKAAEPPVTRFRK